MAENREQKAAYDMLIAILTCVSAPLLAHSLDLLYGDANPWKSDRLVVLYFASVAGYIISAKCLRLVKESKHYARGLKLGNSDAFQIMLWMIPVLFVTYCYDYLPGIIVIAMIFIIAIIMLYRDGGKTRINIASLCISGILAMLSAAGSQMLPSEWAALQWMLYCVDLLFIQVLVCLAFDVVALLVSKIEKKQKSE